MRHAIGIALCALLFAPLSIDAAMAAPSGPSFDCALARSPSEILICADADLSQRDVTLGNYYQMASARSETWQMTGDTASTAAEWFVRNTREEWNWREEHCTDRDCLVRWYDKRTAVLKWLAESEIGFGDGGIRNVIQLADNSTLLSIGMATHVRNVRYLPARDDFHDLPDGDLSVISENPFVYRVDWQKGYFVGGGAYWYSTIRNQNDEILEFVDMFERCLPLADFLDLAGLDDAEVGRVSNKQVCFEQ